MKEPKRYSMSTGLPVEPEVKSYPLKSAEQAFWDFISKHKKSREEWHKKKKKINEDNQKGNKTELR